ncbi:MAG: hypothetical protein KC613_04720, partial [Myxococcales bacterium]|nr:hypothetical protein [Myxococcales bacterium]
MRRSLLCLVFALPLFVACDDEVMNDVADLAPLPEAGPVEDAEARDLRVEVDSSLGQPCTDAVDCPEGFCVDTPDGNRVCSERCGNDEHCPEGWRCRQVTNTGPDVTFICVPEDAPCAGADLQTDLRHCGACERPCEAPGAEGACVDGVCGRGPCRAGFHDVNGDAADGCEYACTVTRGGDEACDSIDNDCDGRVDEGFDTA